MNVLQANMSNERQVTIRDVDFHLSGNFSCEVTTDAPTFSTSSNSRPLTVVCTCIFFSLFLITIFLPLFFSCLLAHNVKRRIYGKKTFSRRCKVEKNKLFINNSSRYIKKKKKIRKTFGGSKMVFSSFRSN